MEKHRPDLHRFVQIGTNYRLLLSLKTLMTWLLNLNSNNSCFNILCIRVCVYEVDSSNMIISIVFITTTVKGISNDWQRRFLINQWKVRNDYNHEARLLLRNWKGQIYPPGQNLNENNIRSGDTVEKRNEMVLPWQCGNRCLQLRHKRS